MAGVRGQSNLVALAIALMFVTAAIGVGTTLTATAFPDPEAERERRIAADTTAALLSEDSPLTRDANVFDAAALLTLDAATLHTVTGLPSDVGVRVQLGSDTVLADGAVTDGTTIRRLIATTTATWERRIPDLDNGSSFPVAAGSVIRVGTRSNTTLESVRVDGRLVASAPDGLSTPVTVSVPIRETVRVNVSASDRLTTGAVWVATPRTELRSRVLVVTVDA